MISQLNSSNIGEYINIKGKVFQLRQQSGITFILLKDGSNILGIQCVYDGKDEYLIKKCNSISRMDTLQIFGYIVKSPAKGQEIELQITDLNIIGKCSEDYPLGKTKLPLDFLRSQPENRINTDTFQAVMRIRSKLSMLTHEFFQSHGFFYINTPIITSNDCEGAGETFNVSSILGKDKINQIPCDKNGNIDYSKDFFGKKVNLTVSGQLNLETYAMSLGKVYTFGPTFRAEKSNTSRHLAEFWMIEPEILHCSFKELKEIAENYIKYCINGVLKYCITDLEFLNKWGPSSGILIKQLKEITENKFKVVNYTDAIKILENAVKNKEITFENPVSWGIDLSREHETYLTDKVFNSPVIATNYPSKIKSFYMKENKINPHSVDDLNTIINEHLTLEDKNTVMSFDVLLPRGIGEIIGGSMREDNYTILKEKMDKLNINIPWYLNLRKYGTAPHGGFGLGFERLVMLCTGMTNIKDTIPFPRYPLNCDC